MLFGWCERTLEEVRKVAAENVSNKEGGYEILNLLLLSLPNSCRWEAVNIGRTGSFQLRDIRHYDRVQKN